MRDILLGLREKFGEALHVMSALADGADQLVAEVTENLVASDGRNVSVKVVAVSPMPLATYRTKVSDTDKLARHWDRAALKLELPELTQPIAADYDELQYEQLGTLLTRRCHLLLALWDGLPPTKPPGGTASVVRMRREGEHTVASLQNSPLFAGAFSRLDLSPGGPVLQVVTPQAATGGKVLVPVRPDAKAGDCFLLPAASDNPNVLPAPVQPAEVFAALSEPARHDFRQIIDLNRRITRFRGPDSRVFEDQLRYLGVPGVADPGGEAGEHLGRLRQWQAGADTAAQFYQRRLLGQFAPAPSWRAMPGSGWRAMRRLRRPPRLGVLFLFAAAVPVGVLMFESYAHLGRSPWALGAYLAIFAGSALFYHFYVLRRDLQNRFQDYRALAEAMRVQLFWAAAATPAAASDHYLRKQSGELGWIQFALRGPALWAAALAMELKQPLRELVTKGWIVDQLNYYGAPGSKDGKARLHEQAAKQGRRWARVFLFAGLGVAAVLAAIEVLKLALGVPEPQPHGPWRTVGEWQERLLVVAATAPAIAAFFTLSVDLRAYEAHAHSYALMGRMFARALRAAEAAADDREFQAIARELGREALAENAEWLLDHRHRPIEHQ